jgi:hypothetical protein
MTIKDIIILSSITPLTVIDKPSEKTVELLAKIITDPEYLKFVGLLRQQYNFPKEGLSIKAFIGKNLMDYPPFNNEYIISTFKAISDNLCRNMGITSDFHIQMILLMLFNAFVNLESFGGSISKPIQFIVGKKNIAGATHDYSYEIGAIIIPYNTTKNKLIEWIRQNWSNIDKQIGDNLETNPYLLRVHRNTTLALEIIELKEEKKMTFPEIATYLFTKYPDDERVADETWVKDNYYTHKLLLNLPIKPQDKK